MLRKAKFLDPRESPAFAIEDSVNIPLSQLADRVYELPRQHAPVTVANVGEEAKAAAEWLQANDRPAHLSDEYRVGESGPCRLWWPNLFLEEVLTSISPGNALDLACGAGREAVHLADLGHRVSAIDHLPDALEMGRRLERQYLTGSQAIRWLRQDLEKDPVEGSFDLVVCFFFMNRDLLRQLPRILTSGGSFVFETFTTVHRETFGKPRREAFAVQPGELVELMPDLEIQRYEEGWHGDRHTARYWGVRASLA